MTAEDMKKLTNRFNQIKNSSPAIRNVRFKTLLQDISAAFPSDLYAARMYAAVCEEMEV